MSSKPSSYGAIPSAEQQCQRASGQEEGAPLLVSTVSTDNPNGTTLSFDSKIPSVQPVQSTLQRLWSNLVFNWITPLLHQGNVQGQLNVEDLHSMPLPKDCETSEVYKVFLEHWEKELDKARESKECGKRKSQCGSGLNGLNGLNGDADGGEGREGGNGVDDVEVLEIDDPLQHHYQPSLIRALAHSFRSDFLKAGVLKLIHDSNLFVGPQVLNRLIRFLRDDNAPTRHGLMLTIIVTLSQILMSLCLRHYFYLCYTTGLRIRTAVVLAIYRKSLLLSLKERHAHGGPGEIANLVGIDAQRMQDLMTYLHAIWYSFFQIGLAIYFLWWQVGPSCLAGVVVILCLIPTTKFVGKWLGDIQKRLMKARDERVALNNEILGSMKVIKIQAWEENFKRKLLELRDGELVRLKNYFITGAISVILYSSAPLLVALATFAAYTLSGNQLDVAEALTALALFDILRFPLFMFPQIMNRLVEAGISFERVREFLVGEEYEQVGEGSLKDKGEIWMRNGTFVYDSKKPRLEDEDDEDNNGKEVSGNDKNGKKKCKKKKGNEEGGIKGLMQHHRRLIREAALDRQWETMLLKAQLLDAEARIVELEKKVHPDLVSCVEDYKNDPSDNGNSEDYLEMGESGDGGRWSPSSLLSLRRVCLHCKPGDFVAVVGAVGAGKSTLINSILGEGRPLTGTGLAVKGKLAAFLQTPFIMNDTVKNNILFGHAPPRQSNTSNTSSESRAIKDKEDPVDESRYELALKVCSLSHDLQMLPSGDQTEIGEKGITLSGGQKARVALARALYHDADVYLLDDPLAAVDAHVAKDLFHGCIVEEMLLGKSKKKDGGKGEGNMEKERNATVILVTNAIQFLNHPMVDKIVVLGDGCVEEVGTFAELSSNPKSRFSSFLAVMAETSKTAVTSVPEDEALEEFEVDECDDLSDTAIDFGNEPEVAKVIDPSNRRFSYKRGSSTSLRNVIEGEEKKEEDTTTNNINDGANDPKDGALMTDEFKEREKGSVDKKVYIAWANAGGGLSMGILILCVFAVVEGFSVASKWWLTHWSQSGGVNPAFFLAVYALINFGAIGLTFCRLLLFILAGLRASTLMFVELLDAVLYSPMSFFDTTPIGRIVNRFSKDMYTIDEQLVMSGRSYLATMATVISSILVVTAVTPLFLLGLFPIILFYLAQQAFFTMTYRELKRLDSVTRSPIYALLGETLDGVMTIRAFQAEDNLNTRMVDMLDIQQTAYYLTFSSQCWLSIRLEFAGSMIILCACFVSVLEHGLKGGDEVFAGLAGLSISFALSITQSLNWTVRMASDLEANMVAVERIQQYFKLPNEAPRLTDTDTYLPPNWPVHGKIDFKNAKLRYRPGLPLVLKGLDISIPAQSKVGVVGRTGAGKSTLMVALLRIVELDSGSITIDDVDIGTVGLMKLRSNIAVIPQDPVLFSGTVRSNLDPFDEYDDSKLFEALTRVGLHTPMERVSSRSSFTSTGSAASEKKGGRTQPIRSLSEEVSEGGSNFSVGQRQLLVIARAMLAGSRIVIMDEATASVDADTDARIQKVLREEFKHSTCITVAHRLNTIMDSDYVLVMDDGMAAEFDKPSTLLTQGGIFKSLVDAWEEDK